MQLFEIGYQDGWKNFVRYFDTDLDKSCVKEIDNRTEYFEPDPHGAYQHLITGERCTKFLGKAKDAQEKPGVTRPIYRYIRDNVWEKNKFNLNPRIWYLDIETRSGTCSKGFPEPKDALEPISLIQFFDSKLEVMFILGYRNWEQRPGYELDYKVKYFKFEDELSLLEGFRKIFAKLDPLIVYAWNGMGFDYPYLVNRAKRLGIEDLFANYGHTTVEVKKDERGRDTHKVDSPGHVFFDMIDTYKRLVLAPRDSYSLDNIAHVELGDNKIQHDEYIDFDSFYTGKNYQIRDEPYDDEVRELIRQKQILRRDLDPSSDEYKANELELEKLIAWQFVYYGIYDVYLLKKLDDKIKMSTLYLSMAALMGCQITDIQGTIKKWAVYISNVAYKDHKIAPKAIIHDQPNIVGGFVRDPIKGKHEWILNADVNSMYPMLSMAGFNMSPETILRPQDVPADLREIILKYFPDQNEDNRFNIPKEVWAKTTALLKKYNLSLGINGAVFDRSKIGIIPSLVKKIYFDRKASKKKMLKYEQQAEKIKAILNS